MHIVALCATERGRRFVDRLMQLCPGDDLTVFSFREDPWERKYLDDIREFTEGSGHVFYEARHVGSDRWNSFWDGATVDLIFAVNWRYKIPAHVYHKAHLGSIAFHDSLLPKYRGFSPTCWAIVNGEPFSGATMFFINEDVDDGPIIDQVAIPINMEDTIREVNERVTEAYLDLVSKNIDNLRRGLVRGRPQDRSLATYACKRLPTDNEIDWNARSRDIYNLVRAVTRPYQGAFTTLRGKKLYVWSADPAEDKRHVGRVPGRVTEVGHDGRVTVLTGDGALVLREVQFEADIPRPASEVLISVTDTLGR